MKLPKLLDCTLRDGGYINNWNFSQHFGEALYRAISESGCDYIEVGFLDPESKNGLPWTNLSEADLSNLRERVPGGTQIAVMINYGTVDIEEVPHASNYPADIVRVATPKDTAREATEFASALSKKGFATTINYMGISNYTNSEILELIELMNEFKNDVDYFYVADSFGSLLPKRTREIFTTLRFGTDVALGFHPHNNLQLAFANCLEAIDVGVDIIDGSVFGMGRGAGNLFTDAILAFYEQQNPEHYKLLPVLKFAELYMEQMKEDHSWGYSLPQLLAGVFHCHPNYPTNLLRERAYTADDIYRMLRYLREDEKPRYSSISLDEIKKRHLSHLAEQMEATISPSMDRLCRNSRQKALLVCGGHSIVEHTQEIEAFIDNEKPAVISVNNPKPPLHSDGVFFGNRRRLLQYHSQVDDADEVILGPEIHDGAEANFLLSNTSRINPLALFGQNASPFPLSLPSYSSTLAILGLFQCGFRKVYICGLDGYSGEGDYYYEEKDSVKNSDVIEQVNVEIRTELELIEAIANQLDASFEILTPTLFSSFYSQDTLSQSL